MPKLHVGHEVQEARADVRAGCEARAQEAYKCDSADDP